MTVRRKISIVLGLSMLVLVGLVHLGGRTVLERGVLLQEKVGIRKDIDRLSKAFEYELASVDQFTNDYSSWDDTCDFIARPTDEYLKSNVVETTFTINKINLMIYLDAAGRIVHARAFDFSSEQNVPVPAEWTAQVTSGNPWPNDRPMAEPLAGILVVEGIPYLVVSRPILDSQNRGPIRGTLIVARKADEIVLNRLSQIAGFPLKQRTLQEPGFPSDVRREIEASSGKFATAFKIMSESTIAGFFEAKDLAGRPAWLLSFETDRDYYAQFRRSLRFFLLVFVGFAFIGLVVSEVLIEKLAVSRLSKLSAFVRKIDPNTEHIERAPIHARDEITDLSRSINGMLESLQTSNMERRELIRRLETDSLQDALTGLYNRRGFLTIGKEYLNLAARNKTRMHLLFLDMDNLKSVNDRFGHSAGDEALVRSAEIIRAVFRGSDVKGRLGGDEFAVFPIAASAQGVKSAISRFNEKIAEFNRSGLAPFKLSFSAGVAGYDPEHPSTIEELLARADKRMYEDKRRKTDDASRR